MEKDPLALGKAAVKQAMDEQGSDMGVLSPPSASLATEIQSSRKPVLSSAKMEASARAPPLRGGAKASVARVDSVPPAALWTGVSAGLHIASKPYNAGECITPPPPSRWIPRVLSRSLSTMK